MFQSIKDWCQSARLPTARSFPLVPFHQKKELSYSKQSSGYHFHYVILIGIDQNSNWWIKHTIHVNTSLLSIVEFHVAHKGGRKKDNIVLIVLDSRFCETNNALECLQVKKTDSLASDLKSGHALSGYVYIYVCVCARIYIYIYI
jgi:hypothetical protein